MKEEKIEMARKRLKWIEQALELYEEKVYTEEELRIAIELFTNSINRIWKN